MNNRVNIPLQSKTRHANWRVLWIFALLIGIFLLSTTLTYSLINKDVTSELKPISTTSSVHIRLNSNNISILDSQFGKMEPFSQKIITFDSILKLAHRQITIHLNNNSVVGITIDSSLPEKYKDFLKINGFHIKERENITLISIEEEIKSEKLGYRILLPFGLNDGNFIFKNDESIQKAPFKIYKDHIDVNLHIDLPSAPIQHVSESTTINNYTLISSSNLMNWLRSIYSPLREETFSSEFSTLLEGVDERGTVFSIKTRA